MLSKEARERLLGEWKEYIKLAKEKGFWIKFQRVGVCLSPEELEKQQSEGKYIWGVCNASYVDPKEIIIGKRKKISSIEQEIIEIERRIKNS